jgi:predicted MFS family arabinose efflux permease
MKLNGSQRKSFEWLRAFGRDPSTNKKENLGPGQISRQSLHLISDNSGMNGTLALLSVSIFLNYVDRSLLSVSVPAISKEFSLSSQEMGFLLSAFFWSYSICQPLAGWLVDKYRVKPLYGFSFLLWSLSTAATGISRGMAGITGARLVLGGG